MIIKFYNKKKSLYVVFTIYSLMFSASCSATAKDNTNINISKQKNFINVPLQPGFKRKDLKKDFTISNIKEKISKIPKLVTIHNDKLQVDFLASTIYANSNNNKEVLKNNNVEESSNSQNQADIVANNADTKIYLGRKQGKDIYYVKDSAITDKNALNNEFQINNGSTKSYMITYNHKRDTLGIFEGVINLVLKDKKYLAKILNDYDAKIVMSYDKYATIKLNNITIVPTAYQKLSQDSNIEHVKLILNEDSLVLH